MARTLRGTSERYATLVVLENAHASLRHLFRTHRPVGCVLFALVDCSRTDLVTVLNPHTNVEMRQRRCEIRNLIKILSIGFTKVQMPVA